MVFQQAALMTFTEAYREAMLEAGVMKLLGIMTKANWWSRAAQTVKR